MRLRTAQSLAGALVFAACGGNPGQTALPGSILDAGTSADGGAIAVVDAGTIAEVDAGNPAPTARGPLLAGCPTFGPDSEWNRDISGDPADQHSADYLAFMNAGTMFIHPDFGAPEYGMPFKVVGGDQARVPMSFRYASQSNPGPYPFPADIPIQTNDDRHAAVVDRDNCVLYETYYTWSASGGFSADSGARFDLRSSALRPDGWTSATASGLPMVPGLIRTEEALDLGEIRHALLFTAGLTAHGYLHPATHSTGTSAATYAPPMGLRLRLRADFDLSTYHGTSLVVLTALKRYGMFLLDNATSPYWSVAGAKDPLWPTQDLEQLKSVPGTAFEVVRMGEVHPGP